MINYAPFWETLKKKEISTYYLINNCGISSNTINSIRQGKGISTLIINDLCNILECSVSDILTHTPDSKPFRRQPNNDK